MRKQFFGTALGRSAPWRVSDIDFDEDARRLTIRMDFRRGSRFAVAGWHSASSTTARAAQTKTGLGRCRQTTLIVATGAHLNSPCTAMKNDGNAPTRTFTILCSD